MIATKPETAPKSKNRSVVPTEVQIRPCYVKPIDIQTSKVDSSNGSRNGEHYMSYLL